MATATWNGFVLAESEATVQVEGNRYFPAESLSRDHFRESSHTTTCGWKGTASYYDIVIGDAVNQNAAWYYPEPKEKAAAIRGHVAFWKGVEVTDGGDSKGDGEGPELEGGACRVGD